MTHTTGPIHRRLLTTGSLKMSPGPPQPGLPAGGFYGIPPCPQTEDEVELPRITGAYCLPRCSHQNYCPAPPPNATATPSCDVSTLTHHYDAYYVRQHEWCAVVRSKRACYAMPSRRKLCHVEGPFSRCASSHSFAVLSLRHQY